MEKEVPVEPGEVSATVFVNNTKYIWDSIEFVFAENNTYRIKVQRNPRVENRRKYPRLSLNATCTITSKNKNTLVGVMKNKRDKSCCYS